MPPIGELCDEGLTRDIPPWLFDMHQLNPGNQRRKRTQTTVKAALPYKSTENRAIWRKPSFLARDSLWHSSNREGRSAACDVKGDG